MPVFVTVRVSPIPPPTVVVAPAVADRDRDVGSRRSRRWPTGSGSATGWPTPLADGAADADGSASPAVGSPSGEGDIVRPKLGDGLGAAADGSSFEPKAAWSSHQPSHRTTSRPTMTAARRRQ